MRRAVFSISVLLVLLAFVAGAAGSTAGGGRSAASLDLYTGVVSSETLGRIVRQGYDIADARPAAGGVRVDLVLTKAEVAKLVQLHAQDPELLILPAHDRRAFVELFGADDGGVPPCIGEPNFAR